jgi:HlyD family secretion protein
MAVGISARTAALLLIAAGVIASLWYASRPAPLIVQGEIDADRVDVTTRVSGRAVRVHVSAGDSVRRGDILVELENPQLAAQQESALAALAVARADLARIESTRPEVIAAREADLARADAELALHQASYERDLALAKKGAVSQQRLDELSRNLEVAERSRQAAQANLQLAVAGASEEERAVARANVARAEAQLGEIRADVDDLVVRSPMDGEVTTTVVQEGELFGRNSPLMSLVDVRQVWFVFNLREDLLAGLEVGDRLAVRVPAIAADAVPVRVTVINALGRYATWRATKATGDFDLRTFEVRAVASEPVAGLRPGMSAIVNWEHQGPRRGS